MKFKTVKLGDLCQFISGGTPSRTEQKYFMGDIPWITGADITDDKITPPREYITEEAIHNSATNIVPQGNILLVTRTGVGKVAINYYDICISQDFTGLIPDTNKIDIRYLYRLIQARKKYYIVHQRGATIQGVTRDVVIETDIPLPPLPEQKRIAAILDKVDELRLQRQHAIQRLDDLMISVFLDMFGDPVTNPKSWDVRSIDPMCDLVRGSSPRPKSDPRYYGGPIPRLMVADLTRDGYFVTPQIDSLTEEGAKKSRPIKKGTVVMAVSGNVGLTAILNIDACIHDGFVAFKDLDPQVAKPKYFLFCMSLLKQTHETRKDGAIFQNLTTKGIKAMHVPIPPLNLQNKWDKYFDKLLSVLEIYEHSYSTLENLFHSLPQRAFKGELTSFSDTT